MFFIKELTHTIQLHPSYFGPYLGQYLQKKLLADVEGSCSGRYGYIILVVAVGEVGRGVVQPGTGLAEFIVRYQAIVMRPFKGEVMDAVVTVVNKMGFFAEAGPLQVFVSTYCIPPDMTFDANSNPPCYTSEEETIERGTKVRLKIVGTRVDATEIFAIGSLREDYLSVIG